MSGCCAGIEGGIAGGGSACCDLQGTTDAGNTTLDPIAISGGVLANAPAGMGDLVAGDLTATDRGIVCLTTGVARIGLARAVGVYRGGMTIDNTTIVLRAAGADLIVGDVNEWRPAVNNAVDLGQDTRRWIRIFAGSPCWSVLEVGDASATLDEEHYIRVTRGGAAGVNTLTLPAGASGQTYFIEVDRGVGTKTIELASTGGDTIMGLASPYVLDSLAVVPGLIRFPGWVVWARSATDWRVSSFTANSSAAPVT